MGMEEHTCLHNEPVEKGRKKKTLDRPSEKGEFFYKKNPGINPGQPAGKGREKKNPGINLGQPAGKGREKKKPWY